MLQTIFVVCVIATVLLLIFRKKLHLFWITVSPLIGLTGGVLSITFWENGFLLCVIWTVGLPMLLIRNNKEYAIKSSIKLKSNESSTKGGARKTR